MSLDEKKNLWGIITGEVKLTNSMWIAHLRERPNWWACGLTEEEAVEDLINQLEEQK